MAFLTKEQILAKEKLEIERVPLGKDHVFVRQMTAHEHSIYQSMLAKEAPVLDEAGKETGETTVMRTPEDWPSKLVACCLCDEKGTLILQPEDWEVLAQNKTGATLDKIATAALKLNRIKDQEAAVKNSGGGKAAASNSGSA
jgi:hypothetical protein